MIVVRSEGSHQILVLLSPSLSDQELEHIAFERLRWVAGFDVTRTVLEYSVSAGEQAVRRTLEIRGRGSFGSLESFLSQRSEGAPSIRAIVPATIDLKTPTLRAGMQIPDLWLTASLAPAWPVWLSAIGNYAFELVKLSVLSGKLDSTVIRYTRDLLTIAGEWGIEASTEIVGILIGHLRGGQILDDARKWELEGQIDGPFLRAVTHTDALVKHGTGERIVSLSNDTQWCLQFAKAIITKTWQSQLSSFSQAHRLCELPVAGIFPLAWVHQPEHRERLLEYVNAPDIAFDEFVDLARFIPPSGYWVTRRLSNTSAFKTVFRGSDAEGHAVALKRYRPIDSKELQRVLTRLGMTMEDVLRKDTATHWLGRIRHSYILPCAVARDGRGDIVLIEPLVDVTLERIPVWQRANLLQVLAQVAEALAYLHDERWVHSDLKPDNIGLQGGRAVLLDFGIASVYTPDARQRSNPGSIKTRAPELFADAVVPTFASDVWAFGATAMALATGGEYPLLMKDEVTSMPPAGDPRRTELEATIQERIRTYRQAQGDLFNRIGRFVDPPLLAVIAKACAMNPADRPPAKHIVAMLGEYLGDLEPGTQGRSIRDC